MDDRSLLRAALELHLRRHYPQVVAVCQDAVAEQPEEESIELRLLLAEALFALRHDLEGQRQLRVCLRQRPRCAAAYRLLGELSLRRDELASAEIFLREAGRLDGGDRHAAELLTIVIALREPTAAVEKLPAATAAVGSVLSRPPARARPPRVPFASDPC